MIALFVISILVIAVIIFFGQNLSAWLLIILCLLTFILINAPSIIFMIVGDKPLPDSRIVTQEEIRDAANNEDKK